MAAITGKIRDLYQNHWTGVRIADFQAKDFAAPLFFGISGRMARYRIEEIDEPLVVGPKDAPLTVSDRGYFWLILAPRDRYFWISAAFSPEKELLEIYIDMTAGNDFTDEENPCYRDLYLDLVVNPEGAVRLLDEDELEQAYSEGKVTPEEYARTKSCALELRNYLEIHAREVLDYIQAEMDGRKMPDMAAPDDRNT